MKIVVLAGGTSTERDVSLKTGAMIYQALKERGHQAILLDVFLGCELPKNTDVFLLDKDWTKDIGEITHANPDLEAIQALRTYQSKSFFGQNVLDICGQADIVFMALHGENGEDGKIQAAFDLMGIRYTGADPAGSSLAMDKAVSKEIFAFYGIPTPKGIRARKGVDYSWDTYPAIVKTSRGGSSVGVSIARKPAELESCLADAFTYGEEAVVEQFIEGREFSVGVLEGQALPVIEIAPIEGFYDYKNKYQKGSAIETCPADLNTALTERMQHLAEEVIYALRIRTYARVDFMLSQEQDIFCLEANTLPGMTPTSLLPQEAQVVGMDFGSLCEKIIEISLKKYQN